MDRVEEAIEAYKKAIPQIDTTDTDYLYQARFNLGICYRRIGNLDFSIDNLKLAIGIKPDRAAAHNNLALSYFENEDFGEALQYYRLAIEAEPSSVHYNNRGLANYHFDNQEEAKQDFDNAIERDPNDATIYFNRGNVFLNWKPTPNFEAAHRDYNEAINLDRSNPKLYHSKGLAFQGQSEKHRETNKVYDTECDQLAIEMYKTAL